MEEKENTLYHTNSKAKLNQEMQRLSELEKSVQSKKMHINFLSKQEDIQEKKI